MYGLNELIYVKQLYLAHEQVVAGNTSYLMPVTVTYITGHTSLQRHLRHSGTHIYKSI